jgi:hypothetical protein
MRNEYKVLIDKPHQQRLLVRPRNRWENNAKIGVKGRGCEVVE